MKNFDIAIRADGSAQIGMGHLMRCLSIALALRDEQTQVFFITNNEQSMTFLTEKGFVCELLPGQYEDMEAELEDTSAILKERSVRLLLVDSYQATAGYLERLNAEVSVFYLDDLGRMGLPVSGLINYNIYGQNMSYEKYYQADTRLILGSQYAPVKAAFRNTPYEVREKVSNILITMGGSDALNIAGQLGERLLKVLPEDVRLTLVCGRFSPHLEEVRALAADAGFVSQTDLSEQTEEKKSRVQVLTDVSDMWNVMQKCDLAIAAAGSTMYELCTMGVPTICCYYVENQRRMAECFGCETSMLNAGDFSKEPEAVLCAMSEQVLKLLESDSMRRKLSAEMHAVADGMGAWRIAEALKEFAALK